MTTLECESPKHEKMHKSLSTQLVVAIRSIQWSYGIFWASSTTQEGILEWRDGYYNGDIKTRKIVQTMNEINADQIGMQRSEQLKELYKFLVIVEADPQTKRPSASLSPEDLSDSEWYYLVCMSYVFNPNQSLPGKALETGETIWLCNAQHADNNVFSRSLLAKTVVCFPYVGGVIEIGTTELLQEDPNLIQHVKACFLEISKPICSDKCSSDLNKPEIDDKYPTCTNGGNMILDIVTLENSCSFAEETKFDEDIVKELQEDINEDSIMDSPDGFSNGCENHFLLEESMAEGIYDGPSQVHLIDYDLSNDSLDSLSSCDSMPKASENQGIVSKNVSQIHLRELESNASDEDLYYTRTLCAVLGNSSHLTQPSISNCKSSFVKWKKGVISERKRPKLEQSMLKKTLFLSPFMHGSFSSLNSQKENVFSSKSRENTNFQVLKSVVPSSTSKVDKISILGETIKYLKQLEARVKELESYMDIVDSAAKTKRKCQDVLEQISDNYGSRMIYKGMKPLMKNMNACDIHETDTEIERVINEEAKPMNVKVDIKDEEVLIEMKCIYREYLLHDIIDALNNLYLDAHTVESSTVDGVLTFALKAKFRGAATAPPRMIKEALWKVSGNI
ncbi:PREDICTED: transcription factor MYC1-like isoform X2 [Lupinus angustifolius]|uniref:transcription factor MYC1-like isoform X2 n=1 Tax=Lupinus angustifolius TaxID=3871 RepID=UPI00092ECE89|nr:PREDICTED: transcription factor MYC1-like isoform X2 [Lupinus angustifolius]